MMKTKKVDLEPVKAFLSLFIIISSLFTIVFAKMEERRVGYQILKLSKDLKLLVEEKKLKELKFAKLTRPEHVERVAKDKFTLRKVENNQIIHMSGSQTRAN